MADRKKKPGKQPKATAAKPAAATAKPVARALADHALLYEAVESFVQARCHVESSVLIDSALEDLGKCRDLNELFSTPLRRQLFSMSAAQDWLLFLRNAPARAADEDGTEIFSEASPFDVEEALTLLEGVFDLGMQAVVWEHFGDDGDDGDDGEDGDGDGDDAGEGGQAGEE
jgi:hypothetical protein